MKEKSLSFQEVIDRTRDLIREFEGVEKRPWGVEGAMIELQKQVGELSKQMEIARKHPAMDAKNER